MRMAHKLVRCCDRAHWQMHKLIISNSTGVLKVCTVTPQ